MNRSTFLYQTEAADTNRYLASILYVEFVLIAVLCSLHLMGYGPHLFGIRSNTDLADNFRAQKFTTAKDARTTAVILATLPVSKPANTMMWPLHGKVTTQFGVSDLPYQRIHTGIDISSGQRAGISKVVAFKAGTVIKPAPPIGGFGNVVAIDHGGGLTSYYGHLAGISVSIGQSVSAGDTIGTEGSTGHATGPHVHFEVRVNNTPVNPRNYLTGNP